MIDLPAKFNLEFSGDEYRLLVDIARRMDCGERAVILRALQTGMRDLERHTVFSERPSDNATLEGWQPIETVPLGGRDVLFWWDGGVKVGYAETGNIPYTCYGGTPDGTPEWWRPAPAPPAQLQEEKNA